MLVGGPLPRPLPDAERGARSVICLSDFPLLWERGLGGEVQGYKRAEPLPFSTTGKGTHGALTKALWV